VPPKSVAGVLNNESNLRILEKLKGRPYYPRELAAEMKLSEPFVVRRLKAMEEYDIVEGRWETEGGRKVKRYYVKDVTMQLGKGGLEVRSAEASKPVRLSLSQEVMKILNTYIVMILGFCGVLLNQPVIVIVVCLLMVWQMAIDIALYRHYHYRVLIAETILMAVSLVAFVYFVAAMVSYSPIAGPIESSGYFQLAWWISFFLAFIFWLRFSVEDAGNWTEDKRDFVSRLDDASVPVKLFYLFFVMRWKISEYFRLA
jgi:DNA-binding transcriptional ArsR family regulator